MRGGRIKCFDWAIAEEYLSDFLNMYRAPAEAPGSGASTVIYRSSATKPNDTLQATNYCFVLARIMLGEGLFSDRSLQLRLQQTLFNHDATQDGGYIPTGYSG